MKWLDKNQEKILFFTWCLIILTSLLVIFTSPVNAASSDTANGLPYIVEDKLYLSYDDFVSIWETQAKLDGASDSWLTQFHWNSDNVIGYSVLNDGGALYTYFFVPMDDSSYNVTLSNNYSSFNTSVDYINIGFSNYCLFMFITNNNNTSYYNRYYNSNTHNFLGSYDEPIFITSDFYFLDDVVLTLPGSSPVIDNGHATPPINDNGHFIPNVNPQKPTIIPFNPSSPQFPTVDTSTLEKLVESLIDVVKYGFSYIGGLLNGLVSNIVNNIDNWVDYIVQAFSRGFNNVVGAIQDLATDFYNNMVSLFEPLYDFFNGVATFFNNLIQLGMDGDSFSLSTFFYNLLVPDSEDFAQALLDGDVHHVVPLVSSVHTKFVNLFNSFSNLTPSKVLLIPSFTWHGQIFNLLIDFSWYDDYKVYGDTIISGFLIIGYIYWFVLQLSSMFRGGNSIGHDVAKVGGQH